MSNALRTLINTETLDSRATDALDALDKTFIGTESYMGVTYFWHHVFRHALRGASYAQRRRVHAALIREGLEPAGLSRRHAEIIGRAARTSYYTRVVERIEQLGGDPTDWDWWDRAEREIDAEDLWRREQRLQDGPGSKGSLA
jgi:hypothetical protein